MRKGISISVTAADRVRLDAIVRDRNSPQKQVWRARIVLLTAEGKGTVAIMGTVGKDKRAVWRWQERFMQEGVEGLTRDKTPPSRIPPLPAETVDHVIALTNQPPPHEATHWTAPAMAKMVAISPSSVRRIWIGHGLQPHRVRTFKLSNDPQFAEKLKDVVGLYIDPPAHAVVISLDEKSQIQALDRTQPGLPMKKGGCATMPHEYKRNGPTTLFAALDILDGKVIGRCMQRHRHQEFIRFLNAVEGEEPAGKAIRVILDNYATHKHPKVKAWLLRHQRFTFHFTPTSCSWANAVEGFFAKLTRKRLKRGVFKSIAELQAAIHRFLAETNGAPKPFVWTKSADDILAATKRGCQALESIHYEGVRTRPGKLDHIPQRRAANASRAGCCEEMPRLSGESGATFTGSHSAADSRGGDKVISRRSSTIDAAGAAAPAASANSEGDGTSERVLLEQLKREVMALRIKVKRFDEIQVEFPAWRAKAHRYDTLVGELVPVAVRALICTVQQMLAWVALRQNSQGRVASPRSAAAVRDPRRDDPRHRPLDRAVKLHRASPW